jgi:hypothetical protein
MVTLWYKGPVWTRSWCPVCVVYYDWRSASFSVAATSTNTRWPWRLLWLLCRGWAANRGPRFPGLCWKTDQSNRSRLRQNGQSLQRNPGFSPSRPMKSSPRRILCGQAPPTSRINRHSLRQPFFRVPGRRSQPRNKYKITLDFDRILHFVSLFFCHSMV